MIVISEKTRAEKENKVKSNIETERKTYFQSTVRKARRGYREAELAVFPLYQVNKPEIRNNILQKLHSHTRSME